MQDEFQKKVLDTLKKNLKAVDLSDEQPEVQPVVTPEVQPEVQSVVEPRVLMSSSDFTAFGAPTAAGPTSGGNKDILILPGYGGAAATSASLINFYWNSPPTPDQTGVGTSIRSTIYNYATSTTNPVLVIGGYNGSVNYMPFPSYGGGSGVTAKIWLDPFLGRMDIDYIGFNSGVADTNVAGVLFYDSALNVFKGGNGSGSGKTIAFTSDIPAVASSAALVNTDAVTATRFLIGTVLNTASSGGTSLSTGSGITMGNNVLTATTFQGSLSGTASTSTTAVNLNTTVLSGTMYLTGQTADIAAVGASQFVAAGLSFASSTGTLTAANFSGTASSAARINTDATTATRYLVGTVLNTASGNTQLSTGSGITIGNNIITATTFAGNATTATNAGAAGQWITSRTVTFATGDVTGSFSIDGSANVSNVALTIAANSVALGTDTTGNYAQSVAVAGNGLTVGGAAGEGTDFTVYSNGVSANTVSTLVFRDGSGNFSAGTITASLTGTASIASSSVLLNTTTDTSSTLYLLGSRTSTGFAGTAIYVDTNLSFVGNTITGNLTGTASIASSSVLLNTTTDTASTLYLLGSRSSTGFAGTAIYVDTNVSIVGNTITANLTGTATTATRALNTDITLDTTSQIFLTGSRSNASIGSTPTYVLSGVSALGNTITATTFSGSLSGFANTATNLVTSTLSGTMYLTGQSSSTGTASGSGQLVASGLSFVSSTATLGASFYTGSGIQLSGIVTSLAASTGISVNSATGAVTVTNTGVISLTGTANQVLVAGGSGSATSGNITLTLPQSIATTSSPSFADITLTTGSNSTLATVGTSGTSIVNKQYVDNLAAGLDIHESMRLLQTAAIGASYRQTQGAGSAATGAYLISTTQVAFPAIDGVTISATGTSQRVLITGGFTGNASVGGTAVFTPGNSFIGNGSYYVAALGGAGTSNWILIRTTDADDNIELTGGTFTFIEEGTSYADSGWVCSNDTLNTGSIQFGSTAISFTQFTGGGALGVGQGLTKVGNTVATKVNLFSTGTASGTGFTQFSVGGAGSAGVADTGYYPTFSVRTSGTVAGTALLTLNSDGFSLVGSTSTDRTITVTGSNITLTGGGNTLTLTGSISLPAPTQHGVAYGSSASAVAFLTSGGTGASVLTQTTGSAPVYLGQSQLVVGGATTAAQWQTARTVTFATGDVTGSFSINGTADVSNVALTIAANSVALGTDTTGNYAQSVAVSGSGITLGGTAGEGTDFTVYSSGTSANTVSTLVFRDGSGNFSAGTITANLTGTASIASSAAAVNTVTDTSSTLYLLGSRSSTGIASTQVYVDTNISILGGTITATTFSGSFSGTATSAAKVNTDASTATRFLIGTVLNTASGSTQLSTGSGITIGNNLLTSGGIAVTNTTVSTSTTSGALTVAGGVGIGLTSYFGQDVKILGSTASTTPTTGALTVAGGVGISGSLYVNSNGNFTGDLNGSLSVGIDNSNTGSSASSELFLANSTVSTVLGVGSTSNSGIGGLVSSLGVPAGYGYLFTFRNGTTTGGMSVGAGSTLVLFVNQNGTGSSTRIILTGTGATITAVTASTSSTTGALTVSGGAGIAKTSYFGQDVLIQGTTASTSTSTGALTVAGGVGIGGSLWTATANFSSISGVGHLNSAITSGVWAGTAISLANGGTNANLTAVNGGVVYSTGSAMAISAAGTAGSVLVSAGAAAPTWSAIGLSSSSVTGVLAIANGGNNATTYTTNSITYYDGTRMVGGSSLLYTSGAGVTATENIRAAGFNIAGNSVVTSLTPSGGSAIYGGVTIAVANNGAGPGLSVAGASSTITITGPGTGLTGTGTANSVAKFTASGQLGNSNITDNGTTIALGKATTITDSALSNGTYLTITTAAGDDSSTTDFFIRGLTSGAVSKFSVDANGNLRATTKSFDIEHPTKPGKRLVYGVLEGPEHGVYHRGTIEGKGKLTVELPEYWSKLVGAEYSIQLTPWGNYNAHIVEKSETSFIIQLTGDPISRMFKTIKVDYIIHGSRLDAPLVIEQ